VFPHATVKRRSSTAASAITTRKNGDRSAYFWPVVRIDDDDDEAEVDRNLALLKTQIDEANKRLAKNENPRDPDFNQNAIVGPLKEKRVATIDRIAIAIGRNAGRAAGVVQARRRKGRWWRRQRTSWQRGRDPPSRGRRPDLPRFAGR
jgi:hypothetical protein